MITPVQLSMIKPQETNKPAGSNQSAASAVIPETETRAILVSSIGQDGGLKFLQAHLQDKFADKFPSHEDAKSEGISEAEAKYGQSGSSLAPEATASNIVNFALSLKDVYFRQNEGQTQAELMAGFEAEIREGISDGFASARQYLEDLGQGGDTQAATDETWNLIQEKLAEYFGDQGAEE